MRLAFLAVLVFSSHVCANELPLPDWAKPGTQARSVREALDALHGQGVSFQDFGDHAAASVWRGDLAGSWVFSGGTAGGPPTRYYHYLTPDDGSGRTLLSVICEDTPEACRAHLQALHGDVAPPPVPPAPPPPPHLADQGPAGWIRGPEGYFPARGRLRPAPEPAPPPVLDPGHDPAGPPAIRYPLEAAYSGIAGQTMLRVTIDDTGRVIDVGVEKSSRDRTLDRAAMDKAREWRFRPGIVNGVPTGGAVLVPVQYTAFEGPRGAVIENRRAVDIGPLDPELAAARPELATPARLTRPEQARTFLSQACLFNVMEQYSDHRVVMHSGPGGHSFWTLFNDSSRMKGAVIRRRMVVEGDTVQARVSYLCAPETGACEAVEQYLDRNLRDYVPYPPTLPSESLLPEDRCDPR